ncbi:glycoside hydrolase family 3 protein [Plicaturopsis crispa FD-325 SS-3]|nr:glycoside hydrolase family 3 protein [Plicaturopsis crispa FD-325 SS-3]
MRPTMRSTLLLLLPSLLHVAADSTVSESQTISTSVLGSGVSASQAASSLSSSPASSEASAVSSATTLSSSSVASSESPSTAPLSASSFASTSSPVQTTLSNTAPLSTVARTTLPISSYTFSPYPVPSAPAQAGVFPATDPLDPPPVHEDPGVVPDFSAAWAAAHEKAREAIQSLSLEQKVNLTTGVGWESGRCVGNIPTLVNASGSIVNNTGNGTGGDVEGWRGLCLEDSPLGVRDADFITAFPAGINAASTFNRGLIRARGLAMGQEHHDKGVHVALGPMMNMGRLAQGGRNWEGFGADPFLTGESAYETILGLQAGGVQACAKHFINNEQEHSRTTESSNVDDRTQHEIYAHPFLRSVMAGVASIMCSYNLINGTYACENDKMINDVLKREFGFQGYVMSDWSATESTLGAVAGLDMTMPGDITFNSNTSFFGGNLTAYVQNNTIPESRVDDMATRILGAWYYLHQDNSSYPNVSFNAFLPDDEATNGHVDVQADHYKLVREMGAASTVLLKNERGALPLSSPRSLVLIGSDAGPGKQGPNEFSDQGGVDGILAMGWGSGSANFTYLISPLEAIQARARADRTSVFWSLDDNNLGAAASLATGKSAAIVFVQSDSGEQYITVDGNEGDRNNLTAWHDGDQLIQTVAATNNNTIVVVHSVGPLILEPWIEHPNVTAVLWAGLPGQEAGNSVTDVLYGDWNPTGRLPYTIAKQAEDYGTEVIFGGTANEIISIPYNEGLSIDYRHFDQNNITPRFEFGYGLSYTQWNYSDLRVTTIGEAETDLEKNWAAGQATPIEEGSSTAFWLHRPHVQVTFDIENTGSLFGGEIPQVYVNHPPSSGEPPSVLKGFTNIEMLPGEKKSVSIHLSRYDLSIWDAELQGWRKPNGVIGLTVGASSRDGRLRGSIPS